LTSGSGYLHQLTQAARKDERASITFMIEHRHRDTTID
jgi:hypothetical protein